ncbi:hypothetical protein JGS22_016755 [Streptomyces sp. P38-E01]|uniref:Peptidoglycan binding domain-containing protein n=1 Tax=Streptomyces tardus TaxID=2780544 RepID=A0A949JFS3_9ACTN|nr:hypothetical protein [Streptomyces tardus]MBU7599216.1 hypothetical protein [Streptomyces tardus]
MSRETDSSFPKGNEPDEPKTETTLTTRIRINIPGSRPIPPVVVRKTVDPAEASDSADVDEQAQSRTGQQPAAQSPNPAEGSRSGSDWFAPRKQPMGAPVDDQGPTGTPPDGTPVVPLRTDTPHAGTPAYGRAGPAGEPSAFDGMSAFDGGPPHSAGSSRQSPPTGPTSGPAGGDMPLLPPQFQQAQGAEPPTRPGPTPPPGITEMMKPPVATHDDRTGEQPQAGDPFAGFSSSGAPAGPEGPEPVAGPRTEPSEAEAEPFAFSDPKPAKRKGRSVLVLLGVAGAAVFAIAYGAGLLLNHSDVPNGTTVLGVDIGGSTREEAVDKLNSALGDRDTADLRITVEGGEQTLKPSVAGLGIDTDATVRGVTGRDYNPISVIGSLLGTSQDVEPTYTVDEDKLNAALEGLGGSGKSAEGMVRFENGEAVPVPGRAAMAIDSEKSAAALEAAYKERAAGGKDEPVTLPVSKQQPKITEQEMQRAVKQYGEPAMSGWVWLKAGGVEVPFSEKSISDFFTLRAGGTSLQPHVDAKALAQKYGGAFEGIVVDAGTGPVPMTAEHARAAVTKALMQKAPAEPGKRVAEVEGARSGS